MAKVLIIEDEEEIGNLLSLDLRAKKHTTTIIGDSLSAVQLLEAEKFDIIITSAESRTMPGLKFIEWVKNNTKSAIIIHGFPPLADAKAAFELGVDDFINNKYQADELYSAIDNIGKKHIPPHATSFAKRENLDTQYTRILLEEVRSKEKNDFDLYIRLSEYKYLKVCNRNMALPAERAESFKKKGVHALYTSKDDFRKLVNFSIKAISGAVSNKQTPKDELIRFIESTNDTILKSTYLNGVDKESFTYAREFLTSSIGVLAENFDAKALIESLNSKSDALYNHSLGVAIYAILIARKLGFTSSQVFFKLGLAGLFHDIGKNEIPPELFWKSRPLLTAQERTLVDSHPDRTYKILSKASFVPTDVIRLAHEHHEDMKGTGRPRGLTKGELHPLSKIVITANLFVERVIKTRETVAMPIQQAFKDMETIYGDALDLETMTALKALFT
ncbi:MAG: HD domain-containing protein [Bdellovibrionales bacterium]|nr:HD domain-containing protein [Bdellovibrionales bacterium]